MMKKAFKPPENWANAPEFVPRSFVSSNSPPPSPPSESESPENRKIAVGAAFRKDEPAPSSRPEPEPFDLFVVPGLLIDPPYDELEMLIQATYARTPEEWRVVPPKMKAFVRDQAAKTLNSGGRVPEFMNLCQYAMVGECRYGDQCIHIHGAICEFCCQAVLNPYNEKQRKDHQKECVKQHEKDMELSFAVALSNEKTCGICMEVIMEKTPPGEQRFGILPKCNHCFCLSCIRRWRTSKQFDNKIIRACPECRTTSDFVCPSRIWVEGKEEKEKLITSYKLALSKKHCRYYKNGQGECPFGNKCFYLHALPDGQVVDVGPPKRRPRRDIFPSTALWEFLEDWEFQWMDIDDFLEMLDSDTEESDFDEPDFDEW